MPAGFGINQFVFAFGPGLLGYLHRAAGDDTAALLTCMLLQAVAAIIIAAPLLARVMGLRAGGRIRP